MAKGDPGGLYQPEPFSGNDAPELVEWLLRELNRVSATFELALARSVEFLNVAPDRPREGMICGADGTNWNPGSGKGVYAYYGGAWHFVG